MIPHGVPDRELITPDALKARFGWEGRKVVFTFGLLAPNKGIETIIEALPAVAANHPELLYVVLGATHPNLIAHEGEAYRDRLKALAEARGVADNVAFVDAFVEHDELIEYLQAADIYATPYTNPAQITSGTLSYAVGVGKAVISTPYVHATEILDDDHGVLVPFGDVGAFAREIDRLLSDEGAQSPVQPGLYAGPHHDLAAPGRSGDRADRGGHHRTSPPDRQSPTVHQAAQGRHRRCRADERFDRHVAARHLFDPRSSSWLLHRR